MKNLKLSCIMRRKCNAEKKATLFQLNQSSKWRTCSSSLKRELSKPRNILKRFCCKMVCDISLSTFDLHHWKVEFFEIVFTPTEATSLFFKACDVFAIQTCRTDLCIVLAIIICSFILDVLWKLKGHSICLD